MAKSGGCKWNLKGVLMANKETKGNQGKISKREAVREKRRQEQKRRRIFIVLAIVIGALAIAAIIIVPSLLPAGDIVTITPVERPLADGRAMGAADGGVRPARCP